MPIQLGGGGSAPAKPAPKPLPPVPASASTGNNPRGVAIAPAPRPTVNDRQAVANSQHFSDAGPSGNYGTPQANTFKQTPQYAKAVVSVFKAQPVEQQKAILQGVVKNPQTPEAKILLPLARQQSPASGILGAGAISPRVAVGAIRAGSEIPQIMKNFASDTWNLAPETVEGLYGLGKQAVEAGMGLESGNFKGALSHLEAGGKMVGQPYVQLAEHPLQTFEQHPLNTALMVAPVGGILGKTAGAVMRSGALGDAAAEAASTARAPLHLGMVGDQPSPVTEERSYSSNVGMKALQVAREKALRARGINPDVSQPSSPFVPKPLQYATNHGTEAKLYRISDEMTSTRQAMGRQVRDEAQHEVLKTAPPKTVKNVVGHIVQGVVRKPETAIQDLIAERDRLTAQRTNTRTLAEYSRRRQIRDISTALKHPEDLPAAFDSAAKIRAAIKGMDAKSLQKGLLDEDQAGRSPLFPYAQAHMGATYDHGLKTLVVPNAEYGTDAAAREAAALREVLPSARRAARQSGETGDQLYVKDLEDRIKELSTPTRPLPTQEILDHLEKNDVPDPAYVGHYANKTALWRYYQAYRQSRGTMGQYGRTGAAFAKGNYDHTFNGLAAQMARTAEHLTKAELHDKVVSRLGMTNPLRKGETNKMYTPSEARAAAEAINREDNLNEIPGRTRVVPITATPKSALSNLSTEELGNLQHPSDLEDLSEGERNSLEAAIKDAANRNDSVRNVVLAPEDAMNRFAEQFAPTGKDPLGRMGRSMGRVTQQFRRTVLPYSTHWMAQIGSEAGLRGLIANVFDPRNRVAGHDLIDRLQSSDEGKAALQEMTGNTFFGQDKNLSVKNPNPSAISSAAHAKFSPLRPLIALHNKYADFVTTAMYNLEHSARTMGLGKISRQQIQEFTGSYQAGIKVQGQLMDDLAQGLKTNPALVAKFGRQIDDIFGKYNKFTPKTRAMIQTVMPFLPWYLNAAKYVLWTLPAKHPVASAVLAATRQTINQDIKDGKAAPLNVYEMQELGRLSPFGIFTPPSTHPSTGAALAGQQFLGAILPEAQGSFYNLAGLNSFGSGPLTQAPDKSAPYGSDAYKGDVKPLSGPALAAAAESGLESVLPGAGMVRKALAGGRSTYGTSTLVSPQPKPGVGGDLGLIIDRILNPFYSIEAAKNGPAYGSGSGYTSSGGSSGPVLPSSSSDGLGVLPSSSSGGLGVLPSG